MAQQKSLLLIDEPPLQVLPQLAAKIGLNEAIVLQQVHYWLKRSENEKDGRLYVYKTIDQWQAEFPFWSTATIKRTVVNLRDRGLLELSKKEATSWDRTNWYTIDYTILNQLHVGIGSNCTNALAQNELMHKRKVRQSIGSNCTDRTGQCDPMYILGSESTTETTTKKARGERAHPLPADFSISDSVKAWAEKENCSRFLQAHFDYFVDWARSGGHKKTDWEATFRNCVRADWGDVRRNLTRPGAPKPPQAVDTACSEEVAGERCGMPGTRYGDRFLCDGHRAKRLERKPMPADVRERLGIK